MVGDFASTTRRVVVVCTLAATAAAKPPRVQHFRHSDELKAALEKLHATLKRREDFPKKPREERLVLLLKRGETRFEGRPLTGQYVVQEILGWDALDRGDPSSESMRILALLPDALKERYAALDRTLKEHRYRASIPLVLALTADHRHFRVAATACLKALYGTRLGYRPDLPSKTRKKSQRIWMKFIRSRRR
jgi:hypothetical protein